MEGGGRAETYARCLLCSERNIHPASSIEGEIEMPIEIISKREFVESVRYGLSFEWESTPGAGFSFDCDENGNVNLSDMSNAARSNYEMCLRGVNETGVRIFPAGIVEYFNGYIRPAVARCHCGSKVTLSDTYDGNECDRCHRWYNLSGQELNAPAWSRGCRCGSDEHGGDCMCFEGEG